METNVNYTIVGIFVITLLCAIAFTIIWLSAGLSLERYAFYKVYMKESVTGLSIDAPVEYNGVNVGIVKNIEINRHNPQIVELLLRIKQTTPITVGTEATLNVKGLTGLAYVALRDKGLNTIQLVAAKGEDYPVIKTAPSLFLQLDRALTKLNDNIHMVSQSLQSLLNKDNLNSIKKILSNFRSMTDTLASNRQQVELLLRNSAAATQVFSTQTLPAANQTMMNLDNISAMIKQNPSILVRGTVPQQLGPGE